MYILYRRPLKGVVNRHNNMLFEPSRAFSFPFEHVFSPTLGGPLSSCHFRWLAAPQLPGPLDARGSYGGHEPTPTRGPWSLVC